MPKEILSRYGKTQVTFCNSEVFVLLASTINVNGISLNLPLTLANLQPFLVVCALP